MEQASNPSLGWNSVPYVLKINGDDDDDESIEAMWLDKY